MPASGLGVGGKALALAAGARKGTGASAALLGGRWGVVVAPPAASHPAPSATSSQTAKALAPRLRCEVLLAFAHWQARLVRAR